MPREHIYYLSDLKPDQYNIIEEMADRSEWIIKQFVRLNTTFIVWAIYLKNFGYLF